MALPLLQRPFTEYRGRFAPSPSGLLHFGSLITALASFLDAKAHQGKWLVRIEDIDPPREQKGADKHILKTLECYGLHWDEPVYYQSQQSELYEQVLSTLKQQQLCYFCQCTRAQIKAAGGVYQGQCKTLALPDKHNAIRLVNHVGCYQYKDRIQGSVTCDKLLAEEDFIIKRKDGLYAYQLAVVIDDIAQHISHIVRGCDLLTPTARQLSFYQTLGFTPPQYAHIPLAVTKQGYKLSKQNKAPAININAPQQSLIAALHYLGQKPPIALVHSSVEQIIQWAIKHWSLATIPKKTEITLTDTIK